MTEAPPMPRRTGNVLTETDYENLNRRWIDRGLAEEADICRVDSPTGACCPGASTIFCLSICSVDFSFRPLGVNRGVISTLADTSCGRWFSRRKRAVGLLPTAPSRRIAECALCGCRGGANCSCRAILPAAATTRSPPPDKVVKAAPATELATLVASATYRRLAFSARPIILPKEDPSLIGCSCPAVQGKDADNRNGRTSGGDSPGRPLHGLPDRYQPRQFPI